MQCWRGQVFHHNKALVGDGISHRALMGTTHLALHVCMFCLLWVFLLLFSQAAGLEKQKQHRNQGADPQQMSVAGAGLPPNYSS